MLKENRYREQGQADNLQSAAATSGQRVVLSNEDEALVAELAELTKKHTNICVELEGLTLRLNKSDKDIIESYDRLKRLNVELAMHEKEMKTIDNEIFVLKKRRAVIGLPEKIEERFQRQEAMLQEYRKRHRTLIEELSGIDTSMRNFDTVIPELEAMARHNSVSIKELSTRKDTLERDVLGLEKVAASFVEKAKLEKELSALTGTLEKYTEEIPAIKDYIKADEFILPQLRAGVQELEVKFNELVSRMEEVETLISEKVSLSKEVDKINGSNFSYAEEIQTLKKELADRKALLQTLKEVNAPNRELAPRLGKTINAYELEINAIGKSLAQNDEIERKKELAIANFLNAYIAKVSYEDELQALDGHLSKLIEIARSL
ncbi:MAG: hypothetical protein HQK89_16645 [Nitrospirae bacterium]|nr:hypothetical protein [Nitrospirota bacterium]